MVPSHIKICIKVLIYNCIYFNKLLHFCYLLIIVFKCDERMERFYSVYFCLFFSHLKIENQCLPAVYSSDSYTRV